MKRIGIALMIAGFAQAAQAEYTIFHPVPDDKLRPMSTERPSKTDSTATVDAGHFQVETSLVNYNYNNDCMGGTCAKSHEWDLGATTTLRAGLTESAELQMLFDAYRNNTVSDSTNGTYTNASGFGDTTLRYKYNFWGNDGGDTALAGVVFAKLPTNSDQLGNDAVEGGFELPFLINLKDGWSISGMTQFNFLDESSTARSYYTDYVNALVLGKSLTDSTSTYVEFYTSMPDTGGRDWQNTLDFGIVHQLPSGLQIDTGINFGVTNAAPDAQWFAGVAYRF